MEKDRKEQWTEPMVEDLDIAERTEADPFSGGDAAPNLGLDPGGS